MKINNDTETNLNVILNDKTFNNLSTVFEIPHRNIMRLIQQILNDLPTNLAEQSFSLGSYLGKNNEMRPMYKLKFKFNYSRSSYRNIYSRKIIS